MSYMTERKRYQTSSDLLELIDKETLSDVRKNLSDLVALAGQEIEVQFVRVTYMTWETPEQFLLRKGREAQMERHDRITYEKLKKRFEGS